LLEKILNHEINQCRRYNKTLALLYVDINGFKKINSKLGRKNGDYVLVNLATRLKQSLRRSDVISRIGGDEFIIILTEIKNSDVPRVARKILEEMTRPINCHGREAVISVSIGISGFPYNGENVENLISKADMAMFESKQAGENMITLASSPDIV